MRRFNIRYGFFFVTLFISVSLVSCVSSQKISKDTGIVSTTNLPRIIFLTYSIEKQGPEDIQVHLINKIISEGKLKEQTILEHTPKTKDLICALLDENDQQLATVHIPDPLTKHIEYQIENGNLARKEIKLDSCKFTIRMQFVEKTRYVALERINTSGKSTLLITEIK